MPSTSNAAGRYGAPAGLAGTVVLAVIVLSACSGTGAVRTPGDTTARPPSMPPLLPVPATAIVMPGPGFELTPSLQILIQPADAEATRIGRFLADLIGNTAETTPPVEAATGPPPEGSILLTLQGNRDALGLEGYTLTVTPEGVTVAAAAPAGLFYGVQTLRQLLPPAVEYTAAFPQPMHIPSIRIEDRPRFEWRGAMLDVARHFFEGEDVKRFVDLMALYKLNRLHLHLSDDQGWRIEIPSWPNLTAIGGRTQVGGGPGGYYSQDVYADLVNYARDRFITVVPEIDMPGHVNAALASYPELNCDDVAPPLFTGTDVGFSALCVGKDVTYEFVEDVVREIAAVTPGPYFHLGGDEVEKLSDEAYQQFIERVQGIVAAHGKRAVGWDETAAADLLPSSLVQLWRPTGTQAAIAKAAAGDTRLILSPADRVYLDMKYDSTTVLGLQWAGHNDVRDAYDWDPATLLEGVGEDAVAGVEAPLWSETLGTLDDVEYMAFPRLAGVAEIGWSDPATRDWEGYRLRLGAQAPRWTALGVNFYRAPEIPWLD